MSGLFRVIHHKNTSIHFTYARRVANSVGKAPVYSYYP